LIVNFGVMPESGRPVTRHMPGAGPSTWFGPLTSSPMLRSRTPMRLVNQLESGTSPSVFTFIAGPHDFTDSPKVSCTNS